MKKTESDEGKTILVTMKADHYRYMAEITHGDQFSNYKHHALEFYKEAYMKSLLLPKLNKIRLGTCLNYSVFYFEVMSDPIIALKIATEALDDALKELKTVSDDNLEDENMQDSLKIIDVIKMNVNEWFIEVEKEENKDFKKDDYKK